MIYQTGPCLIRDVPLKLAPGDVSLKWSSAFPVSSVLLLRHTKPRQKRTERDGSDIASI